METANCLPKSCEKKIYKKNGPSGSEVSVTNETIVNHNDNRNNEDPIGELSSRFKDVSTESKEDGGKVFEKSSNGYWIGKNYCENGIDKNKFDNCLHSDKERVRVTAAVKVIAESQLERNRVVGPDEDDVSSTSTSTTTISTASPGSNQDLEIESCASDNNGGDDSQQQKNILELTKNVEVEPKKKKNEFVSSKSGPFECAYVEYNSNSKSTPLVVHDPLKSSQSADAPSQASTSAMPSVTNVASLRSVTAPMSIQTCSHAQTSVDGDFFASRSLSLMKFSTPSSNEVLISDEVEDGDEIRYEVYTSELQMGVIMRLIQKDLSEPYSIYTYRYFIHNWPKLCFLAMYRSQCVGAIVCKLDLHKKVIRRGYIAMLAVDEKYRKRKIGSNLVLQAIQAMIADDADEVVLETEISNKPALRLYENLGFVRDKRLFRYYLNGVDALRLKLWLH